MQINVIMNLLGRCNRNWAC